MVLFAVGISSAPVTINRAADGRFRSDRGTRDSLVLWPLNEARDGLEPPLVIRDGPCEFVPPTAHTGAYLEEVISTGAPIPAWTF